jgi:phosphopantothenate---cysteine ligase (CTP)
MKLLVTAGNTVVPIDRVRQITNVFTGRTGAAIARHAYARGHTVTLLTSHPEALGDDRPPEGECAGAPRVPTPGGGTPGAPPGVGPRWRCLAYDTFDALMAAMEAAIRSDPPDAVIHSAAVSDYRVAGIYTPAPGTRAAEAEAAVTWETEADGQPRLVNAAAGKVKSTAPELWLRLLPAPKIIDRVREEWGFRGVLVKFKLEVGVDEAHLLEVAEASRRHSGADLMVANTLETARQWAYLGPMPEGYRRIPRAELPEQLLAAIQNIAKQNDHPQMTQMNADE